MDNYSPPYHPPVNVLDDSPRLALDRVAGTEEDVCRAARVSLLNDEREPDYERDTKLLKYLIQHNHWSPFEHVYMTWIVSAPIFVARQWMRHKSWSFNEVSARYTELPLDYYIPDRFRKQAKNNRQASEEDEFLDIASGMREEYDDCVRSAIWAYKTLLEGGVAREQARAVLPTAMYTRFYASCNLRSLIHFLEIRDHEGAQWEMQQYAKAMRKIANRIWPRVIAADTFLEVEDAKTLP